MRMRTRHMGSEKAREYAIQNKLMLTVWSQLARDDWRVEPAAVLSAFSSERPYRSGAITTTLLSTWSPIYSFFYLCDDTHANCTTVVIFELGLLAFFPGTCPASIFSILCMSPLEKATQTQTIISVDIVWLNISQKRTHGFTINFVFPVLFQ